MSGAAATTTTAPSGQPGPSREPDEVLAPHEVVLAGLSPRAEDRPLPHEVSEALEPVLHALPAPRLSGWRS